MILNLSCWMILDPQDKYHPWQWSSWGCWVESQFLWNPSIRVPSTLQLAQSHLLTFFTHQLRKSIRASESGWSECATDPMIGDYMNWGSNLTQRQLMLSYCDEYLFWFWSFLLSVLVLDILSVLVLDFCLLSELVLDILFLLVLHICLLSVLVLDNFVRISRILVLVFWYWYWIILGGYQE